MKIVRDADDYGWFIVEKIDGTEGLAPLSHLNEDKPEGQGPYGQVRYAESAPVSFEKKSKFSSQSRAPWLWQGDANFRSFSAV